MWRLQELSTGSLGAAMERFGSTGLALSPSSARFGDRHRVTAHGSSKVSTPSAHRAAVGVASQTRTCTAFHDPLKHRYFWRKCQGSAWKCFCCQATRFPELTFGINNGPRLSAKPFIPDSSIWTFQRLVWKWSLPADAFNTHCRIWSAYENIWSEL